MTKTKRARQKSVRAKSPKRAAAKGRKSTLQGSRVARVRSEKTGSYGTLRRSSNWASQVLTDIWPQERDFFERPDRYKYVRKLLPSENECVFCKAAKARPGTESLVLAQDEKTFVVMNKFPYNSGHLLILPREHLGDLAALDETVSQSMDRWIRISLRILKAELNCHGFNIGMNCGAVAGAGIPDHMHWHIVPRWGGDTNFFPLIAETKVLPETLEQTYKRLKPHFDREA
ncbi:MAG: HIT family protein [Bdellovibrionales bacterium]